MPDFISITDQDNNRSIKVSLGKGLSVALGENPTTGFTWHLQPGSQDILALESDDYELGAASAVGGSGIRQFRFRAMAAGKAAIRLRYRRSWEPAEKFTREFALDVSVE